jgi:hypothetical protein
VPSDPPLVSVLVIAHDDAAQIGSTLDGALAQEYPADRLEVIVVDDGSHDGTRAVLADYASRFRGRVRVLHQAHAGPAAAMNRAFAEARGDVLAPLVPGDRWPVGRLAAHVGLLERRPEVGLVHSALLPRGTGDDGGATSLWPAEIEIEPPHGRPVGRLLREESIAPSGMAVRASLRAAFDPIPLEIARPTWWLAVRVASVADVEWLPEEPSMLAPRSGARADRATRLRQALAFQRWFLRRTTSESAFVDELGQLWDSFTDTARTLLETGGDPFVELVVVSDAERADARRLLADGRLALERGALRPALALAAQAAATDPWCQSARALLVEALAARPRRVSFDALADARGFVTLAFADELIADPDLLGAYARHFDGSADATLAIDASGLTPTAAEQALGELVEELGIGRDDGPHVIAVLGPIDAAVRERLPSSVDALLTRSARPAPAAPAFGDEAIASLRGLAARASAA